MNRAELMMPGTLDMVIPTTLRHTPLHGYAIAQSIRRISDNVAICRVLEDAGEAV